MIIGHQKQWHLLRGITEINKLAHAYLFAGPEKIGKKTLAKELVNLWWQGNKDAYYSDLILIEPIDQEIRINQIRDLIWQLTLKPVKAPFKVAIIDNAHLMNFEAQTCFLKTLEEPKGKIVLILITDKPDLLLPTILSRVQVVKFGLVQKQVIVDYLLQQGLKKEKIEEICFWADGRPGLAIEFLQDKNKLKYLKEKIEELKKLRAAPIFLKFQYIKKNFQNHKEMLEVLNIWLIYFRQLLINQLVGQNNISLPYSFLQLKKILELIQENQILLINGQFNWQLAFENLLLEI